MFTVLRTAGALDDYCTGQFTSIRVLGEYLTALEERSIVIGCCRDGRDIAGLWPNQEVWAFNRVGPASAHYYPGLKRRLKQTSLPVQVADVHNLWMYANKIVADWAHGHDIPVLLTPHGNFNPVALQISRKKKAVARRLVVDKMMRRVRCVRALTPTEASHVRAYGVSVPIAVIPNGIEADHGETAVLEHRRRIRGSKNRIALFIGRLHHVKGLDLLIRAWARLGPLTKNWTLAIAGPDEGGYQKSLEALMRRLGVEATVNLIGPVLGESKREWLTKADVLCLPSRTEGLPTVALEGLAYGRPLLLTEACNLPNVVNAKAGLEVTPDVNALAIGLGRLIELDDLERESMGQNGLILARSEYSWELTAARLHKLHLWMCGMVEKPTELFVDNMGDTETS
jgi:glycosyltransferase involved in cell wall biosynthesis